MNCHLEIKPGVRLHGLTPEMAVAAEVVRGVYEDTGLSAVCVITVGIEGQHTDTPCPSGHYRGDALDFRTHDLLGGWQSRKGTGVDSESPLGRLRSEIERRLGGHYGDYFVLLESWGTENEHIHVEHRPSKSY